MRNFGIRQRECLHGIKFRLAKAMLEKGETDSICSRRH